MKHSYVAACAALVLAACGQQEAPAPEAPPTPQSLMQQVQAQAPEIQLVTAYQALLAHQQAHPEVQPPCTAVRGTESRGVIPANVAPDSIYAGHAGSLVFSIQCGALRSQTRFDPTEHWLVVYAPAANEPAVVNCADVEGVDQCPRQVPVTAAPAAPAAPAP